MTNDPGLKKMISFLGGREDVHKHLFQRAQLLIQHSAPPDQFNELIIAYKLSLQTFEN